MRKHHVHRARRPRRRYYKKKQHPTTRTLSKKITKLQKNEELKYGDFYQALTPVAAAGTAYLVCTVAQGDSVTTRTGNKITLTSLQLKYNLDVVPATLAAGLVRLCVVLDRFPNQQAAPFTVGGTANLLLGPNGLWDNTTIGDNVLLPRALEMQGRYKVLYDKMHNINPNSVNVGGTSNIGFYKTYYRNIRLNHQQVYIDGAAATGSILKNSLYIVVIGANCSYEIGARAYFKDA